MEHSGSRPLDALQVLAALARHAVEYVLIGGAAMQVHGHVRTTQDVDVIANWTTQNMSRLGAALRDLDARLRGIDADLLAIDLTDPRQLLDGGNFLLHTRHGDLDVFAVDQTALSTHGQVRIGRRRTMPSAPDAPVRPRRGSGAGRPRERERGAGTQTQGQR